MNRTNRSYGRRRDRRPALDELPVTTNPVPQDHQDPTLRLGVGCRWSPRLDGAE